jgi:hypothetical protein
LRPAQVRLLQTRRERRAPLLRHARGQQCVQDRLYGDGTLLHPGRTAVLVRVGVLWGRAVCPRRQRHAEMYHGPAHGPGLRRVGSDLHLAERLLPWSDMQHRRWRGPWHLRHLRTSHAVPWAASTAADVRDLRPGLRERRGLLLRLLLCAERQRVRHGSGRLLVPLHRSVSGGLALTDVPPGGIGQGPKALVWSAVLVALAGCGLVSRDVTKVSFDLPTKSYAFDTNGGAWKLPVGMFPRIPCGATEIVTDCCNPPAPLPHPDCGFTPLSCESGACTLRFPVTVVQQMDLKQEVPALANINSQYLVDIYVSQIRYAATSTLNVDLPGIDLFVAPDGVTSAADPAAEKFGTVPITPALTSGDGLVEIAPNAEQVFARYAHEPATPFNFIATTVVVIPSGSPIPSGSVALSVTGQVSASL